MAKLLEDAATKQPPEKKFGPFHSGIGVAIWLNEAEDGERHYRSITIAPRRYYDRDAKKWKDAGSYQPADVPALIYALQLAQAYCFETPLPEAPKPPDGGAIPSGDEAPF
jgi:hypothetical protein